MTDVQKAVEETKPTAGTETGLVAAPNTTIAPSVPTAAIMAEAEVGGKKGTVEDSAAPASASNTTPTHADRTTPGETAVESADSKKPITEGVLGYKAPGLVKYVL